MTPLKKEFQKKCWSNFGKSYEECNSQEQMMALSYCIMEDISEKWINSRKSSCVNRQAFYLSSEFLMGRALSNNLINLRKKDQVVELIKELGLNYFDLENAEPDAGLGNGGLGRLAACFLDSAATHGIALQGYGLRYEYGIFRQKIEKGFQKEYPDKWLKYGQPWAIERVDEKIKVTFADMEVYAVPYDTPVIGYESDQINTLRLWSCKAIQEFDLDAFNAQNYSLSVKAKENAENITQILYPNDSTDKGKILRIRQQYVIASASLQDMVRQHKKLGRPMTNFHEYHVIQLNDTHPAVAIPEMMRLLMEQESFSWDEAWTVVTKTFAYTNHTILEEALEKWSVKLYKKVLPNIYKIISKINKQFKKDLKNSNILKDEWNKYLIIESNQIHMARLSIYGCFSVNGVARLHTDILMERELKHFHDFFPGKFNNKTNGITQRRWLLESNPELANLISELLDSDQWITDLEQLKGLEKFTEDEVVLRKFIEIKKEKKNQLADYIAQNEGIVIDRNSIFDIQIKRLHEYKRQLLNAFYILDLYYRIKKDPHLDIISRTFVFGAKSAPGYDRAKGIIKFIHEIKDMINKDVSIQGKIKVVFIENYSVSNAQILFPAADISQQISTAGKEASGTGNMKFMLNGAPTLGTYDGANVEIVQEAGEENNFIFGLRVEDIEKIKDNYDPKSFYLNVKGLKKVVDTLQDKTFEDGKTGIFKELYQSILKGATWHQPDVYYLMADFDAYREAQDKVDKAYRDELSWAKKCWMNIANSGKFSSDRTIKEYAKEIWRI